MHCRRAERIPLCGSCSNWCAPSRFHSSLFPRRRRCFRVGLPARRILRLAVYLVTFILAFGRGAHVSSKRISQVAPFLLILLFPIFAAGPVLQTTLYLGLLAAHLVLLFVGAMLCHAALAERRPPPAR